MKFSRFFSEIDDKGYEILDNKRQYTWKDFVDHASSDNQNVKKQKAQKKMSDVFKNAKENFECPNCAEKLGLHSYETGRYFFVEHETIYCLNDLCDFAFGDLFRK